MSDNARPALLRLPTAAFLIFFLLHTLPTSFNDTYKTYNFSTFAGYGDNTTFVIFKDAKDSSSGALQLTPDTMNDPQNYLVNKSGRVFLSQPFTLWKQRSSNVTDKYLASFHTNFTINIFRPNNDTPGEGMTFLVAVTVHT